jgi:hypothetical protein
MAHGQLFWRLFWKTRFAPFRHSIELGRGFKLCFQAFSGGMRLGEAFASRYTELTGPSARRKKR